MKKNFLFAVIAAVLVAGLGIFLIGRDGTENNTSVLRTSGDSPSEALPIDASKSTSTEELEVVLEEDDASSSPVLIELPASSTSTEEIKDNGIVFYTDAGFSPKTISINKGDSVTFTNNSSRNMWVASNLHPTHNDYPLESESDCLGSSFDACQGIAVGETWEFTFDIVGKWVYHDHLNVSRTGTVIVE